MCCLSAFSLNIITDHKQCRTNGSGQIFIIYGFNEKKKMLLIQFTFLSLNTNTPMVLVNIYAMRPYSQNNENRPNSVLLKRIVFGFMHQGLLNLKDFFNNRSK